MNPRFYRPCRNPAKRVKKMLFLGQLIQKWESRNLNLLPQTDLSEVFWDDGRISDCRHDGEFRWLDHLESAPVLEPQVQGRKKAVDREIEKRRLREEEELRQWKIHYAANQAKDILQTELKERAELEEIPAGSEITVSRKEDLPKATRREFMLVRLTGEEIERLKWEAASYVAQRRAELKRIREEHLRSYLEANAEALRELEREAPDLAQHVREDSLTIEGAMQQMVERRFGLR